MRRVLAALLLTVLCLLAGVAAGCGGDGAGGPEARASDDGAAAARGGSASERASAARARAAARAKRDAARRRPVRLTVLSSGDLLIHSPVWQQAWAHGGGQRYDFAPLLRELRPYVADADLALCHVEVPMTAAAPSGFPIFNSPPGLARAIEETGWDACSTASNHTLDQGAGGVAATLAALDRAGIRHAGSHATARGPRKTTMLRVRGVRIALLAYTESTNGIPLPHPWSVNVADAGRIIRDARRARRRGADVVLVNLHWGEEYQQQPSASQLRLADRLTRERAITAIVGQHAHVVQPIRWVNGKAVVFGEGNLISNQTPACCAPGAQDGLMARLHLVVERDRPRRTRVARVSYVPVWVRHPDLTVLPVADALRRGLADPTALRAAQARTVAVAGRARGIAPAPARRP